MFFTLRTKRLGNYFCIAAIIAAVAAFVISWKIRPSINLPTLTIAAKRDVFIMAPIIAICGFLSIEARPILVPVNDEVFSAIYCAGIHPLQTISYYMLPNNHILFNLLNNFCSRFSSDAVSTGRNISFAFFLILICLCYQFLKELINNRWITAIACFALALQFPVFDFSQQARGYELLVVLSWCAFLSLFRYINTGKGQWLSACAVSCILGYFCIPVFLYLHLAIILLSVFYQLSIRKADWWFWGSQLLIIFVSFALYLPSICFSGLGSITSNIYVTGELSGPLWLQMGPFISGCLKFSLLNLDKRTGLLDLAIFMLPVVLLFYRKKKYSAFLLGVFFITMWCSCLLIILIMGNAPPERSLIAQFSITLALDIYSLFLISSELAAAARAKWLRVLLPTVIIFLLCINALIKDIPNVSMLYHADINGFYDIVATELNGIPENAVIGFSNDSFYWYYIALKNGRNVNNRINWSEDYLIFTVTDAVIPKQLQDYRVIKQVDQAIILRKK